MSFPIPGPNSRGHVTTLALGPVVATPENQAALVAIRRISEAFQGDRRDTGPNPLFLHGPPGCGKTLLVKALIDELLHHDASVTVCLLSGGDLRRASGEPNSLEAAPHADLVVIEDVQHLPADAAEPLVQLFDDLYARQQQMVFTALTGPGQHGSCPHRLTSRLGSGLVVGIAPLSASSRFKFLQDKAQRRQLAVSSSVLAWVAKHVRSGREIEGALNQLEIVARRHKGAMDVALVADCLGDDLVATQPTLGRITERVGAYFQLAAQRLRSRRRTRRVLFARQISMYLSRLLTRLSLREIGQYFGSRDHTTVLNACRRVAEAMTSDSTLSAAVHHLQAELA